MTLELTTGAAFDFQALSAGNDIGLEIESEQRRFVGLLCAYQENLTHRLKWFMIPNNPLCEAATHIMEGFSYCTELARDIHANAIGLPAAPKTDKTTVQKLNAVFKAMGDFTRMVFNPKTAEEVYKPFLSLAESLNRRTCDCEC